MIPLQLLPIEEQTDDHRGVQEPRVTQSDLTIEEQQTATPDLGHGHLFPFSYCNSNNTPFIVGLRPGLSSTAGNFDSKISFRVFVPKYNSKQNTRLVQHARPRQGPVYGCSDNFWKMFELLMNKRC